MFPLVLSLHILKTNRIAAITLFSMTFFLFVACLQQLFPRVFNKKKTQINRMYWIHKLIDKIDTFYVILFFLMGVIGLMVNYFL